MRVPIGESYFYCDVRHIGDGYYPDDFGRAMLVSREWNQNGFWTPDPVHHRLALAYHAVHHKNHIADEYYRFLGDVTIQELFDGLKGSTIGWTEPKDPTVGRYNAYWKGATSVVEKKGGRIFKKQTGYSAYPLIENEWRILSTVHSPHFPKVYSHKDGVLEMEDCGVSLLSDIPANWEEQLDEILEDLALANIIHRDIRLDNLMVKDGKIFLIDFGWAKLIGEKDEIEPPSCLGFPNRPSTGWNDAFSMRSVKKQITYNLEEKQ
jgi:serine/threonine protein kinase